MPKRKYQELRDEEKDDPVHDETSNSSTCTSEASGSVDCDGATPKRKRVNFDNVHVYYFGRTQGFACVPSQGGTTLGMKSKHDLTESYPLRHYRKMRKIVRRKKADVDESAENSFNRDSILDISQDEIRQTDSEEDETETDGFFLQPVPTKQRKTLLRLSGVKKLDLSEREECKELRETREQCGCDCDTVCSPDTCECAINGIQCQVDRFAFPCGCTKSGCENASGRIEFNPNKVRRHYVHTLKRLETQEEAVESPRTVTRSSNSNNKHLRFSEDIESPDAESQGENSTLNGSCLDCTNFLLETRNTSFDSGLSVPSLSRSNSSYSLTPISGFLNPILNTTDSLDNIRSLSDMNGVISTSSAPVYSSYEVDEDTVDQWQTMSHESMLISNSLHPVESSSDEPAHENSDLNISQPRTHADVSFLSNFQLPVSPHEQSVVSAAGPLPSADMSRGDTGDLSSYNDITLNMPAVMRETASMPS